MSGIIRYPSLVSEGTELFGERLPGLSGSVGASMWGCFPNSSVANIHPRDVKARLSGNDREISQQTPLLSNAK